MSKNDVLVQIGSSKIQFRGTELTIPQPPQLDNIVRHVDGIDGSAVFKPLTKLETKEQLYTELEKQRASFAPFMENRAPILQNYRIDKRLAKFDWRIETAQDRKDFSRVLQGLGEWETKTIPHYGGPLGISATYYRTQFMLEERDLSLGSIFVCFKGVDYKAHVFVNNCLLGSHEGFFAPFEFEFSACANAGLNTLVVKVENDFVIMGSVAEWTGGEQYVGDKIYGATGPGYDDPEYGWHHCPPGMGIYQDVYIESRPRVFVCDVFVRPLANLEQAEAWVEIGNLDPIPVNCSLRLSLYGENFADTVYEEMEYYPQDKIKVGLGDSLTEAKLVQEGKLNAATPLLMEKGANRLVIPFRVPSARIWDPDHPWLYQLHIKLLLNDTVIDTASRNFGMRSFTMDMEHEPKGTMALNGRPYRLRGTSEMGHLQQCVMKKDWNQLRDDILLARICNINYIRFIHRPVQPEIYDTCDMLGMLTQTEMPLFSAMSRSQFCEGVRQAAEMERLVRSHPSNILDDYIDEPFPNGMNKPQRNLTRDELEAFFSACDIAVKLNNPDRIIKHTDGDYDPPSTDLPDSHCYCLWYNGHGMDIGMLNKGYWIVTKPGWYYSCGEYGAEALDPVRVMKEYYPARWLPHTSEEEKTWSPKKIKAAQTGDFHYFFFDTQETLEDWTRESQMHQAWAIRIMTEAFRRDSRMVCLCVHLLIDAFPAGWMKALMDVERTPKKAYFTLRDALSPILPNIRTDRLTYFSGEDVCLEAWVCNDNSIELDDIELCCMIEAEGELIASGKWDAKILACTSEFQGFIKFKAPAVQQRGVLVVRLGLRDKTGKTLNDTEQSIEVFPVARKLIGKTVAVVGQENGVAARLALDMGCAPISVDQATAGNCIILDDYYAYAEKKSWVDELIAMGSKAIFIELPQGEYAIADGTIHVRNCRMLPLHFVSRKTFHPLAEGFKETDFKLWHDASAGYITPIIDCTFSAEGFAPILTSGNVDSSGKWAPALAAGEKKCGNGSIVVCELKLAGRTCTNPVAAIFADRLLS